MLRRPTKEELRRAAGEAAAGRYAFVDPAVGQMAEAADTIDARMAVGRDYHAEYLRRQELARERAREAGLPEPTARQAVGHQPFGEPGVRELERQRAWGASWYIRGPEGGGLVVNRDVTRTDARRAGRYMALAQKLAKGRVTPGEFRRQVQRMPKIDGTRPLSDPAIVLALVAEERAARRRGRGQVRFESGKAAIRRARELLGLPPEPPARPTRRRRT